MKLFELDNRENTKRIADYLGIKVNDLLSLLHISKIEKAFPFNSYLLNKKQVERIKEIVELLKKVE